MYIYNLLYVQVINIPVQSTIYIDCSLKTKHHLSQQRLAVSLQDLNPISTYQTWSRLDTQGGRRGNPSQSTQSRTQGDLQTAVLLTCTSLDCGMKAEYTQRERRAKCSGGRRLQSCPLKHCAVHR